MTLTVTLGTAARFSRVERKARLDALARTAAEACLEEVAQATGLDVEAIRAPGKLKGPERARASLVRHIVVFRLRHREHLQLRQIVQVFNLQHVPGARQLVRAAERHVERAELMALVLGVDAKFGRAATDGSGPAADPAGPRVAS
jgi:hypothetical protein